MGEDEASTFEALGNGDEAAFGPPAALIYGLSGDEASRVGSLLERAGAPDHRVVGVTTTMGEWTVGRALGGDDGGQLLPVGKVPRVVLLSGLTDRQVNAVLDAYRTTDLPKPIFAVATPANLEFTVVGLLGDLMAELQAAGS